VEEVGDKLEMDNFFPSRDLLDDLHKRVINCCVTVSQNRKGMPEEFDNKILKLKRGDIHARERGVLTAMIWKNPQDVCITNQAEGNFCVKRGRAH
jgi:hypothetical protein